MRDSNSIVPNKSFFRIGEVSRILGVEPHVVRFWEAEFATVKPLRTKTDQRLYRKKDVENLIKIKKLLYEEKFTIAGAKRHLASLKKQEKAPPGKNEKERLAEIKKQLLTLRKVLD